ncbi:hypothetical protein FOXYSP1_18374 [Fusarium oxysporum f. sp. phaseoli]
MCISIFRNIRIEIRFLRFWTCDQLLKCLGLVHMRAIKVLPHESDGCRDPGYQPENPTSLIAIM